MLADRYSLFIFDWDGTLIRSTPLVRITRLFKKRYNVKRMRSQPGQGSRSVQNSIESKASINRFYAFIYDIYASIFKPELKPGAMDLIKSLKENGKRVAIFSDANRHRLFIETRALGILENVDLVLSADSIKKFKPDPTGLVLIRAKFRTRRDKCIYIGDMAVDIFTARFAGIKSCAVCDGVDSREILTSAAPDYIVGRIGGFAKIK